jgi:WD40 repeat protein
VLAFSPDAAHFAAAAFDGTVRFWDAGGAPVGEPIARPGNIQVHSVAYDPNGRSLAAAYQDGAIGFWRSDGKETSPTLMAHQGPVYSIDFDAATKLASAGADESVRFWGPSGQRLGELPPPRPRGVRSIAIAPNGDVLATGDDRGVIRIWNLDGAMRGSPITAHGGAVDLLAWSPDSKALASAGADRVVCAWTVDGKKTAARKLPDLTTALAYSPDGQTLATVTRFAPVRFWQGAALMPVKVPERMRGHTTSLAYSPDGTMMAGTSNVIQIWNVDGSSSSPQVEGAWGELQSVAFSPKGDVVAAGTLDGKVRLWNLDGTPNGEPRPAHRGAVYAVAFAPDGRLASGGDDGAVAVWPVGSGAPVRIDAGRSISKLGFMSDGRLWVRGSAGDLRLFDRELRPLGELYFNTDGSVVISYDGWFSGEWPPLGWQVEVYRDGKPVGVAATASRFSPERVRARLAVDGRESAKSGS